MGGIGGITSTNVHQLAKDNLRSISCVVLSCIREVSCFIKTPGFQSQAKVYPALSHYNFVRALLAVVMRVTIAIWYPWLNPKIDPNNISS